MLKINILEKRFIYSGTYLKKNYSLRHYLFSLNLILKDELLFIKIVRLKKLVKMKSNFKIIVGICGSLLS